MSIVKAIRSPGNALATSWLFNQLAYAIVYPFVPLYLVNERGLPYTLVSLIFPLMGLMLMVTPTAAGVMTDRLGRNLMMDLGMSLRGVIFMILAVMTYLDSPFWLFAVMLMLNAGTGVFFQVGADAYLADITTLEERPKYYSKIRIGFNVGWAVGPMLGAFFAKTPFWLFFLLTAMLSFAGTVFTHYVCRAASKKSAAEKHVEAKNRASVIPLLFKQKQLLYLLIGSFFLYLLVSQLYSTMSIYSTGRVGVSREALGSIYSLNGFIIIALQIPMTALLARMKVPLKKQLIMGTFLYGTGFGLLGLANGAWMIAAFVFMLTVGEVITQPSLYSSVSAETSPENAGRIMASLAMVRGVAYAAGPWFGSILFECIESSVLLWICLAAFAFAAAGIFSIPAGRRVTVRVR